MPAGVIYTTRNTGRAGTLIPAPGFGANAPVGLGRRWSAYPGTTIIPTTRDSTYGSLTYSNLDDTLSIVDDATAYGGKCLRVLFPAGHPGGGAPSAFEMQGSLNTAGGDFGSSGYKRTLYVIARVRFSANWTMNNNVSLKFASPRSGSTDNNFWMWAGNNLGSNTTLYPAWLCQNQVSNEWRSTNVAVPLGQWFLWESVVTYNASNGSNDASARAWIDGTELTTGGANTLPVSGTNFLTAGNFGHEYLWCDMTYGGGANAVPVDMSIDFDWWDIGLKAA